MVDSYVSLLIGALGAALIGLLGAWIQSRREHSLWVRERRFDAYLKFLIVTERATDRLNRAPQGDDLDSMEAFSDALNTLRLVGPDFVWWTAWDYWGALMEYAASEWPKKERKAAGLPAVKERPHEESLERLTKDRQRFVDEAQRAVRVSYRR